MDRGSPAATHNKGVAHLPLQSDLRVKIFADGANEEAILSLATNPVIKGFTTNPTLMRSAGVTDYEAFARRVLGGRTLRVVS